MSSVNKVILIGNLGNDPEIRTMQSGDKMAQLSIATSESWKDKNTGEKREKTEWHRVVVFNRGLVGVIERYVKKGSKVYIEGALETRSWEQDGQKKYTTEVVLKGYNGSLTMLDSRNSGGGGGYQNNNQGGGFNQDNNTGFSQNSGMQGGGQQNTQTNDFDDEIPF